MLRHLVPNDRRRTAQLGKPKELYQILAYAAAANAGALTDSVAVPDSSFSARGGAGGAGHWIFTEPYNLVAAFAAGATISQVQLFDATWNAINIEQIYPTNKALAIAANPNVMDLRMCPLPIPMNEEVACQISCTGPELDYAFIWIQPPGDPGYATSLPAPSLTQPRILAIVNVTVTLVAGNWSAFVPIVFVNPIKGGAYQVNGAEFFVAAGSAFKINFVKAPLYQGRKLFPGGLCSAAYGNNPLRFGPAWLGPMGRFNNFELPQLSVFGNAAAASATYVGVLDLTYLGNVGPDAQP